MSIRLIDLDPQFVTFNETTVNAPEGQTIPTIRRFERHVDTLAEAQGMFFGCPTCFVKNGNSMVGTHGIVVAFAHRGVPDHLGSHGRNGQPTRWGVSGTGYEDLTLTPSIDISENGDGEWHGFITGGAIR